MTISLALEVFRTWWTPFTEDHCQIPVLSRPFLLHPTTTVPSQNFWIRQDSKLYFTDVHWTGAEPEKSPMEAQCCSSLWATVTQPILWSSCHVIHKPGYNTQLPFPSPQQMHNNECKSDQINSMFFFENPLQVYSLKTFLFLNYTFMTQT